MECQEAHEIIEKVIEDPTTVRNESLDAHLRVCSECAGYLNELEHTWDILGSFPSIKPSPEFAENLYRKIKLHRQWRRQPGWIPALAWQWAVAGACVLVLGTLLTLHLSRTPALLEMAPSGLDAQDERFLQDLDQSLQQTTGDYLQVFDSWHESTSDLSPTGALPAEPAPDSEGRGKSSS